MGVAVVDGVWRNKYFSKLKSWKYWCLKMQQQQKQLLKVADWNNIVGKILYNLWEFKKFGNDFKIRKIYSPVIHTSNYHSAHSQATKTYKSLAYSGSVQIYV